MYSKPVISERCPVVAPHSGCSHECRLFVPRRPKCPVSSYLLDAQLDAHGHRLRRENQVDGPFDVHTGHFGVRDPGVHRYFRQHGGDLVEAFGVLGEESLVRATPFEQQREERAQQVGVGARPQREVQVGQLRGLGAPRIDHDHPAVRVVLERVERVPGVAEPVRLPGVAAEHDQQVAVLDVLGGVHDRRAEQVAVDPEVAGLLLRQRVEVPRRVHPLQQRRAVGAAGVVALATAADVGERAGPPGRGVGVPDRVQLHGDLGERGVPVDGLVRAVGPPSQR